MESVSVEQFGVQSLVYPSSSPPHDVHDMSVSLADSQWHQSQHHTPPNSSGSSAHPSPLYGLVNESADSLSYPSSSGSPSYVHHHGNDAFSGQEINQASPIHMSPDAHQMAMGISQVPGQIGPNRVLTRRQTRALQQTQRRASAHSLDLPSQAPVSANRSQCPMYFVSRTGSLSRPQTPNNLGDPPRYQHQPDRGMPVSMCANTVPISLQARYPSTPSPASPYSNFPYYTSANHSRSTSSSYSASNPRSASPALSVASALTSISSASAANCHNFSTLPHPAASTELSPSLSRSKQRKQRLFNIDRKSICQFHKENPNARQEDIALRYGVERSTISKILKHKTKWMNVPEDDDMRVAKHRPSKFPDVEEQLVVWLKETKQQNITLTDALIRAKAKETAKRLGLNEDKFKASSGWVENFKHRHGIRKGVWHGEAKARQMAQSQNARNLLGHCQAEVVLSPLNPAFDGHIQLDEHHSGSPSSCHGDIDVDIESEDGQDVEIGDQHGQHEPVLQDPLQNVWQTALEPGDMLDQSASPDQSMVQQESVPESSMVESRHDMSQSIVHHEPIALPTHPHIPVAEPPPDMHMEPQHEQPVPYSNTLVVYQAVAPAGAPPGIGEAEDAINKVITFVDSQPPGLINITPHEREALMQVKYALFQAANGVPYTRDM